jgi:tRNA(His) 5'-end guanylyltransferase
MQLQLDDSLRNRIAGVTFGMVTIRGVTVSERNDRLWGMVLTV